MISGQGRPATPSTDVAMITGGTVPVTSEHRQLAEGRMRRGMLALLGGDQTVAKALEAIQDDRTRLAAAAARVVGSLPPAAREAALAGLVGLFGLLAEVEAMRASVAESAAVLKRELAGAEMRMEWAKEWKQETRRVQGMAASAEEGAKRLLKGLDERLDDLRGFVAAPDEHLGRVVAAKSSIAEATEGLVAAARVWQAGGSQSISTSNLYERVCETSRRLGDRYALRKGWKPGAEGPGGGA